MCLSVPCAYVTPMWWLVGHVRMSLMNMIDARNQSFMQTITRVCFLYGVIVYFYFVFIFFDVSVSGCTSQEMPDVRRIDSDSDGA